MNKNLLDQIPAEEQSVASKINSLVEHMQPSQSFQWDLENQLMDKATRTKPAARGWFKKIAIPLGWGLAVIAGVLLLNWTVRSLAPLAPPTAGSAPAQEVSFVDRVRSGNICTGTIALAHGFDVFVTNKDKTGFIPVDEDKTIGEFRSFTWSPDGKQLTLIGNTTGSGNILITDPTGGKLEYLLSNSEVGYLWDASWSRDGKQLLTWSAQNNKVLYLINSDGTGLVEKQLEVQILGTPQFTPDGKSIVFYGGNRSSSGLFEVRLDGSGSLPRLINAFVEDETSFAFSPDGSRMAYMAIDRTSGRAILMVHALETGAVVEFPGSLPIPKGSGSSIPEVANLSWSADGQFLVFDFGRYASDRAIYLAQADGKNLTRVADSAYAPSISADGRCLAYISEDQVFLMDLSTVASTSTAQPAILVADLPKGRGIPSFKLDKLQWNP